jgi:hypothetical protein
MGRRTRKAGASADGAKGQDEHTGPAPRWPRIQPPPNACVLLENCERRTVGLANNRQPLAELLCRRRVFEPARQTSGDKRGWQGRRRAGTARALRPLPSSQLRPCLCPLLPQLAAQRRRARPPAVPARAAGVDPPRPPAGSRTWRSARPARWASRTWTSPSCRAAWQAARGAQAKRERARERMRDGRTGPRKFCPSLPPHAGMRRYRTPTSLSRSCHRALSPSERARHFFGPLLTSKPSSSGVVCATERLYPKAHTPQAFSAISLACGTWCLKAGYIFNQRRLDINERPRGARRRRGPSGAEARKPAPRVTQTGSEVYVRGMAGCMLVVGTTL